MRFLFETNNIRAVLTRFREVQSCFFISVSQVVKQGNELKQNPVQTYVIVASDLRKNMASSDQTERVAAAAAATTAAAAVTTTAAAAVNPSNPLPRDLFPHLLAGVCLQLRHETDKEEEEEEEDEPRSPGGGSTKDAVFMIVSDKVK